MYQIIAGDCLPTLRGMTGNSVDLVCTDPPYGISFMGKEWDRALPDPAIWRECLRVLKPGGSAVVMSGSRLDCLWRMCRDLESAGFELSQTALYWCYRSGFPKGGDLSKMADLKAGAEREVVGKHPDPRHRYLNTDITGGRYIGGSPGTIESGVITAPATDLARELDGWFTKGKVKPAVEVIIWARKPTSEKTELANMERWGVGGVNCGACMVPVGDNPQNPGFYRKPTEKRVGGILNTAGETRTVSEPNPAGRYPANLLCVDNSALGEGAKYFSVENWAAEHGYTEDGWAEAAAAGMLQIAKPSRAEKNAGCEGLDEKAVRPSGNGFAECTVFNGENGDPEWRAKNPSNPSTNNHATVKPVRLMAYIIEFLTKPGAVVCDPFAGSGTTGVAAVQAGRDFVGCEMEAEYVAIAEARLAHAAWKTDAQLTLTG